MFRRVIAATVSAGVLSATLAHAVAQSDQNLQLKGYCPASYLLSGEPVKGDPQFAVTIDGKLYYCANAEAKAALEQDPEKYLPQFNGVCTTALGGQYKNWLIADPTVFDIVDGKVYLFSSARAKAAYDRRPEQYRKDAAEEFNKERLVDPVPRLPKTRPTPRTQTKPVYELLNKSVPPATFHTLDGQPISTGEMKGKANILMFYATWCSACKKTLPRLQQWADGLEGDGVNILCVSMDRIHESGGGGNRTYTKDQVAAKWKELELSLPLALDTAGSGRSSFSVTSFPTLVMFDGTGMVRRVYLGGGAVASGQLDQDARTLVTGGTLEPQKIEPAASRPTKRKATELINTPLPDGNFEALDGSEVSLKDPTKQATLAVFYTSWCKYCNRSMPQISAMAGQYRDKPVRFVAINQENIEGHPKTGNNRSTTRQAIEEYWMSKGLNFNTVIDPEKIGRDQFLVSSYPTMMLIDGNGNIKNVYIGARALNDGQVDREIRALLGE